MRQILVEEARRRQVNDVTVDGAPTRLAAADPQQARIVELRFVGGLTADATADALGFVSRPCVANGPWQRCGCMGSCARNWVGNLMAPS